MGDDSPSFRPSSLSRLAASPTILIRRSGARAVAGWIEWIMDRARRHFALNLNLTVAD